MIMLMIMTMLVVMITDMITITTIIIDPPSHGFLVVVPQSREIISLWVD